MTRPLVVLVIATVAGCESVPDGAYLPPPNAADTRVVSTTRHRAATAAGDEPRHYSYALIATHDVSAFTADDATFYFSDGLALQPAPVVDALVAHEGWRTSCSATAASGARCRWGSRRDSPCSA